MIRRADRIKSSRERIVNPEVAGEPPLPFLTQHTSRVTHVHLSDRRAAEGTRAPFGTGDAPIRDVLRAMRDNQWPFPAIIALEDALTDESERASGIPRAIAFCRATLSE